MDEEQIITLFFARSEQAIEALDAKYGKLFHSLSYHIVNDRQDADECVNDAYLGAWNAIPPAKPDSLLPYMARIVRNISLKCYWKKGAAKRNSPYTLALQEVEECLPDRKSAEEEVEFADRRELRQTMRDIAREIDRLRDSFALGNAIKEGVPVAIAGAPNVGKSTLLNRLLGEERAMVSEIAGTTRDVIEECANIGGVLFRFLDTAGIRTTDDHLERMGIERTMASIRRARIVIRLTDATAPEPPEQFALRPDQTLLRVVNKLDLRPDAPLPEGAVGLSARNGEGIDRLCRALRGAVDTSALYHGDAVVSNSRHYAALTQAREALSRAIEGLDEGLPTDLLSEEIRQVIRHLGSITGGDISAPEVLSHIFSNFCIGK